MLLNLTKRLSPSNLKCRRYFVFSSPPFVLPDDHLRLIVTVFAVFPSLGATTRLAEPCERAGIGKCFLCVDPLIFETAQLHRRSRLEVTDPGMRRTTKRLSSEALPTTEPPFITHTEVSALKPIAHVIHPAPPGVGTQTSAGVSPPAAEPLAKCASLQYEYSLPLLTIPLPLLGTWSVLRLDSEQAR